MPDDIAVPESGQPNPATPAEATAPKSRNMGLIIALAVLAVLVVVGAVVAVLMLFVIQAPVNETEVRVPDGQVTQQQSGSAAATQSTTPASPAPAVPNSDVFTFRDIFAPLVTDSTQTSSTTTPTETTTDTVDTSDYSADTLYLVSITSDNGVAYANMVWNSTQHKLKEGDTIPNTPWKVLTIRTNDVIMLFGDQQVVLSVGQGISK